MRYKVDHTGMFFYNGPHGSKIYVGHKDMLPKESVPFKLECEFCHGYGYWADDDVPVLFDEVGWALSDPCPGCGSDNHDEYETASADWSVDKDYSKAESNNNAVGFHKALENFTRKMKCAE